MKKSYSLAISLPLPEPQDPLTTMILEQKKRLFEFIRKRVPEKDDAEDILQDVLFLFIQTFRSVKHIEHITSWLFRVARNKIVDSYRKKKPQPLSLIVSETINNRSICLELPESADSMDEFNPDRKLRGKEFLDELDKALSRIPAKQREVFLMSEVEGMSFKEISILTGVPVNTLLSRKRYAVMQLRKSLYFLKHDPLTQAC